MLGDHILRQDKRPYKYGYFEYSGGKEANFEMNSVEEETGQVADHSLLNGRLELVNCFALLYRKVELYSRISTVPTRSIGNVHPFQNGGLHCDLN